MLRNLFMNRYKLTNQKCIDLNYLSKDDDDFIVNKNRPIGDKQINRIPHKQLFNFVEDLLTDLKLTSVIFSSNTKNEIKYFKQSNKALSNASRSISKKKETATTSRNEYKNQFNLIKEHINEYKSNKKERIDGLIQKNELFYKRLQRQKRLSDHEGYYDSSNNIRIQNLNRTIQRCKSHYHNKPSFELPDVELNEKDVYSRLYHNSVFVNPNRSNKSMVFNKRNNSKDTDKDSLKDSKINNNSNSNMLNKQIKKLNLKNVIGTNKGNAFMSKMNYSLFNRCLFKHSGGPISNKEKLMMKRIADNNDLDNPHFVTIKQLKDNKNNTYLHDGVLDNSAKFVKYYLAKNLSPNAQNVFGDTPLHYAMTINNKEIIKLLLHANGNIYIQNGNKETPFDKASIEIRRLLKIEGRISENYGK